MTEQEIKSLLETTPMEDIKQLFEYLKIQHAENQAIAKGATQEEVVKHFLDDGHLCFKFFGHGSALCLVTIVFYVSESLGFDVKTDTDTLGSVLF